MQGNIHASKWSVHLGAVLWVLDQVREQSWGKAEMGHSLHTGFNTEARAKTGEAQTQGLRVY